MNKNIFDFKITGRKSFAEFISLLREDLIKNEDGWENPTLDRFLEAMEAYTLDIDGYYKNMHIDINVDAGNPPWQVFADILRGARVYE